MKLTFCLLSLLILTAFFTVTAQTPTDSIYFAKTKWKVTIRQNGKGLTMKKLYNIVKSDPEAYKEIRSAKKLGNALLVMGITSGLLFGLTLEGLVNGNGANAIPVGASVIYMLATIPVSKDKWQHTEKAIRLYNQSLKTKSLSGGAN